MYLGNKDTFQLKMRTASMYRTTYVILMVQAALLLLTGAGVYVSASLADRSRVVKARKERSASADRINDRVSGTGSEDGSRTAIEGTGYKGNRLEAVKDQQERRKIGEKERKRRRELQQQKQMLNDNQNGKGNNLRGDTSGASSKSDRGPRGDPSLLSRPSDIMSGGTVGILHENDLVDLRYGGNDITAHISPKEEFGRELNSQLTGCCLNWQNYQAMSMCGYYGANCEEGQEPSHDSSDGECDQAGLSFIGISFSVNVAQGNPYSYQLCDQFPTENLIDRDYEYVMSMDEDGWLVGGGYKSFDYSGKMPYIDSSHTELLRIGSIDPEYGGTSIDQVYYALGSVPFPPLSIFPEYVKGGGGGHSGDDYDEDAVPSGDVTLVVSVVEEYTYDNNYSDYELFLEDLFDAMDAVGGGPCMDDHDTDPHMSMARGVKFKSSYHEEQYMWTVNLEVAVWQAMYPNGVVIGSTTKANFPPNEAHKNRQTVGYGNLYFFFDRANITKAFPPSRSLTDEEAYYSTLYMSGGAGEFYQSVTTVDFDYSGSGDNDYEYEHNPYAFNAKMAKHDMTDGWDLPPNCLQEGETFFGIPLSRSSGSNLMSTVTFQEQFDFEALTDRNFTYMQEFGTNHGWLVGEGVGNGAGSIVDKDTAHIPLFYTGTTNPEMGGMSLSDMVKIAKNIEFGTLYIKPAFVFQDDDASLKLQFEADANSALGYLYDNLCKMIGIAWNYDMPFNDYGIYTNCAMHAAGDRAAYGCGPDGANSGGFCPQMTLAYRVAFQSEDHAAAYFEVANNYVDYWRAKYPSGVAVGTSKFCPEGGCLGLFLNRYDLYEAYKPDLGGAWVMYNGGTFAPTISPAPTYDGGCKNPENHHLDRCFRKNHKRRNTAAVWHRLGSVGQFSVLLIIFMLSTLSLSIFLARAKKRKRRGESYGHFFLRELKRQKKKGKGKSKGSSSKSVKSSKSSKSKKKKSSKKRLDDAMLSNDLYGPGEYMPPSDFKSTRSNKSSSSSKRSKSRSRTSSESPAMESDGYENSSRHSRSRSRSRKRSSSRSQSRSRSRQRSSSRTRAVLDAQNEMKEKSKRRQLV